MGRIAFVFSGQGDQYPGMGKELCVRYEAAAKVFEVCDRLRPGTGRQCFLGTEEELKQTANTQPCLFAMEMAAAETLRSLGVSPQGAAGFSLGEVAAATAAGVFDLETGFRAVCRRGALMQAEAEKADTTMAAVLRLSSDKITEICQRHPGIYPVNFNCPGQITVSGLAEQLPGFEAEVKTAGGRMVPLKVKGAFHSPFMARAAASFGAELALMDLQNPRIPLYSNVTARPYDESPAALLSKQIESPVQWESLIRNMLRDGYDTFLEIGPGRTLTNMIRKIDPQVKACTVTQYLEEIQC